MKIGVTKSNVAYFVVWTLHGMVIDNSSFKELWESMQMNFENFYKDFYLNYFFFQSRGIQSFSPLSTNPTIQSNNQTIRRQQPTNSLSVFDHFVRLSLKGLTDIFHAMFLFHYLERQVNQTEGQYSGIISETIILYFI